MSYGQSFHDNQPIMWWKRVPIYATTLLTALIGLGIIGTVILSSARFPIQTLAFSAPAFSRGALWQIFTYPWIELPSFFTLLGMFAFFVWGVEVEKYLGRSRFLQLFGSLIIIQAVICLLWYWVLKVPAGVAGNYHLTAALLIAFAALYPNIEYMMGWIPLKWFAFACVLLGSLMYFPERNWPALSMLLGTCGTSFLFIRWVKQGGAWPIPRIRLPSLARKPKLRVLPNPRQGNDDPDTPMAEVDALLDKIARHGIGSLSASERARLEKAREDLMKRESR